MKALLKRNGKFVKQGGKLVRTDDPTKCCKCCDCGNCVVDQDCQVPGRHYCCGGKCYPFKMTCSLWGVFDASQRCNDFLDGDPTASVTDCCPHLGLGITATRAPIDKVYCSTPYSPCSEDNRTPVLEPNFPPPGYQVDGCIAGPTRTNPLP